MSNDSSYLKNLQLNSEYAKNYYLKSINKTYQQDFLERSVLPKLIPRDFKPMKIADIACGGGTLTYHLSKIFPDAHYFLSDLNSDAIKIAREINSCKKNIKFLTEDFYNTSIKSNYIDLTFCMQTLSWVQNPKKFLSKILEITKNKGYFIISSLFNITHDVDIYCKIKDHTLKGNIFVNYNTFSKHTIKRWLKGKVEYFEIIPFEIKNDLKCDSRGLGSYTIKTINGERLTFSGGLLLNWGFLIGKKKDSL